MVEELIVKFPTKINVKYILSAQNPTELITRELTVKKKQSGPFIQILKGQSGFFVYQAPFSVQR